MMQMLWSFVMYQVSGILYFCLAVPFSPLRASEEVQRSVFLHIHHHSSTHAQEHDASACGGQIVDTCDALGGV